MPTPTDVARATYPLPNDPPYGFATALIRRAEETRRAEERRADELRRLARRAARVRIAVAVAVLIGMAVAAWSILR